MKTCRKCRQEKFREEFYSYKRSSDGLQSYCKGCSRESLKGYKATPESRREYALKSQYGITTARYHQMLSDCGCRCQICRTVVVDKSLSGNGAVVDHHHETGEVRGILCRLCNMAIGLLKDDPALIMKAAEYLNDNGHYGPKEAGGSQTP